MLNMSLCKRNEEYPWNEDEWFEKEWTAKNAFIYHSITKCGRYHYKPKRGGKNAENIIRHMLEAALWDLLNSAWFAMARNKVSMEHTVKNWRKQDKNRDSHRSFIPTPDDEVPFYSQIVTGDKPIERHPLAKEKIHGSTFIRSPLKNVYTFEVIPDLGESDSSSDNTVEGFMESRQRRNVYPSTTPCHNIPPVVVSGIFESLMSDMKIDLLGDYFDAIHDKQ